MIRSLLCYLGWHPYVSRFIRWHTDFYGRSCALKVDECPHCGHVNHF